MAVILPAMADFDKLWDYQDPAGTEAKFRELLPRAEAGDPAYLAELLTQIARTQGLQTKFDEGHRTLDRAEAMLSDEMKLPRVRYLLERGRVFNSCGQPDNAMPYFEQAWKLGEEAKLPRYAVDAVHMIAIAKKNPKEQVEWNLRGIAMVDADPSQRGWLYAFYNNLGEAYARLGEYEKGLDAFRAMAKLDTDKGNEPELYTLKDQSRMLRALGRSAEAAAVLQPALNRLAREQKNDGWISEEHGEILLAQGKPDAARPHFAAAYGLLSNDPWVVRNEPAKLERLRRLSE